jgi:hypothetical protein
MDMWKTCVFTTVLLIFLNLGLFTLNNNLAWTILGLILLLGALYLAYRQGMGFGHEACRLLATLKEVDGARSPVDEKVAKRAWSVNRGVKAVLATALVPYLIGCAYIVLSLLKVDNLAVPMRLVSWVVASPYWPCILPWTHTFDRLTGAVAAVLMISPFVMPLVTFAGYMQGPKLWAKSEKAMAEGKRRAKAKSRVVRKKRVPRSQRPEI